MFPTKNRISTGLTSFDPSSAHLESEEDLERRRCEVQQVSDCLEQLNRKLEHEVMVGLGERWLTLLMPFVGRCLSMMSDSLKAMFSTQTRSLLIWDAR